MNLGPSIPPSLLLCALASVLSLATAGCGQRACFFWTEAEGACPSQDEAIEFFGEPSSCGGSPIESVDSEGEFDGELCCYDVTSSDINNEDVPCIGGDFGGVGGSGGVSTSVGAGGAGGCQRCGVFASAIFMGLAAGTPANLCPGSFEFFDRLQTCLCTGPCQSSCQGNTCVGGSAAMACFDCGTDAAVGCGNELNACANDI